MGLHRAYMVYIQLRATRDTPLSDSVALRLCLNQDHCKSLYSISKSAKCKDGTRYPACAIKLLQKSVFTTPTALWGALVLFAGTRMACSSAPTWTLAWRSATWRPVDLTLQRTGATLRCGTCVASRGLPRRHASDCASSCSTCAAVLPRNWIGRLLCGPYLSRRPVMEGVFEVFSVAALAAAAAGGGFISPLLGALVAPLQQQRRMHITKPDLQTHVCWCQLDQEQQASSGARRSSMYLKCNKS